MNRRREPSVVCDNCHEALGDSEALRATGVHSGKTWYVHRPSASGLRSMCFRFGVNAAANVRIASVRPTGPTEAERLRYDIALAREVGLDERGCEAVGLDWSLVQRAQRTDRRGR